MITSLLLGAKQTAEHAQCGSFDSFRQLKSFYFVHQKDLFTDSFVDLRTISGDSLIRGRIGELNKPKKNSRKQF